MSKTSKFLAGFAMTAAMIMASSNASAAISISTSVGPGLPVGFSLITDFNTSDGTTINDLAPGFTFVQGNADAYIRDGGLGLDSGQSAPPPANNLVSGAYYQTVEGGSSATLTSLTGLSAFSFYMGSPDEYNSITFFDALGGVIQTLNGNALWGGIPAPGTGDQSQGYTVKYLFDDEVFKITFASSSNSFEFDKLATISPVPEASTWAMMIFGMGAVGHALRSRRKLKPTAVTA